MTIANIAFPIYTYGMMYWKQSLLSLIAILALFGEEPAPKKSPIVSELPEDAVEVRSDVYRRIENGKPFIYVKTPFGITRAEQTEVMRHILEDGPPFGIRVRETAIEYLFDRATPFGPARWTKKKDSNLRLDKLTSEEQESIDYHRKLKELTPQSKAPQAKADAAPKK